ncbi:MAG: undecaprenyldiphospho-muramoylpentapeptide beta-N-acetylglucosaminyltransferase [Acidobacteria bacterium]|nr:undecaprenyldiphospho-muramoylpentapeptide beta-N-acetylglucosaminyltransferase [Acidobacteriota bacterium]
MLRRVLFAGGGTGGHVYMAVALAQELRKRDQQVAVLFVGTSRGMESRIVPASGFELHTISIGGLKNVGASQSIRTMLQVPLSVFQSLKIIRRFNPSIIVGLGGYSSGPLVLSGKLMKKPVLLIEPNVHPGFVNRLLGRWAEAVAVAFPETARRFGNKAKVTGIPIRKEFYQITRPVSTSGPLHVLVFGGSRGSRRINQIICDAVSFIDPHSVSIVHQTGRDDFSWVAERHRKSKAEIKVFEFIEDMPFWFEWADVVVSRSGASTVAEITASGRPALLIPFPYAADDHQRKNAQALARSGAAWVLEEQDLTGEALARIISQLSSNRSALERMAAASISLAKPDSLQQIINLMEEVSAA